VQDLFRLSERGSDWNGDEIFLSHHLADRNVEAAFEAQIAVGKNADEEAPALGDRHARDFVFAHDFERRRP